MPLTAIGLAVLFAPDKELDVEEVVFAQSAFHVVNHPFGAAA